jgi:signal transduction histidine kinase
VIVFAIVVAAAVLASGLAAAWGVRRLPTLRLQLVGLGLLAVVLPLAGVMLSGLVMFESGHDVVVLGIAAAASLVVLAAALAVARSAASAAEPLRRAAADLAAGDLAVRAPVSGPRELAELGRSFNEMAEKLEELFDARTRIVAWASHDLRTPLASIQAMLEAIEDGLAEPAHYLPALREQTARLGRLVDDLFELARLESGALTLELREARLDPLVQSCLDGLEAEAAVRQVSLAAEVDQELTALCEPHKVERVLYNLLTNALRHTPSDGAVAVRAKVLDDTVEVTVEDTGEGLEPEALRRMFDRFWRGDRARGGDGAGLGLAIARALVEAQGGRIWAEPRAAGGACVSFTLPAG